MIYKTSEIDYTIDQDKTLEEINNVSNEDMIKNNLIRYKDFYSNVRLQTIQNLLMPYVEV